MCTSYKRKSETQVEGEETKFEAVQGRLPPSIYEFGKWEADFTKMKGWSADTTKVKNFGELPNEA